MPISEYKFNAPQISAPTLHGGANIEAQAIMSQAKAFNDGLGQIINIVADYDKNIRNANLMATETELTKMFTQRTVEIQSNRKLGDTQGLIDDEVKWVDESKEAARRASKLNDKDFETLWNTQAQNYLQSTGKYQLAEGKKYEEVSKQQYVNLKTNQLASSPLGDLSQLDSLISEAKILYQNDPVNGQKAIDNAVEMYFTLQAMNDPNATLAYYNANKGALIQRYQASAPEIGKIMKGIESNLRSQQTLAVAYDNRALALEARAQAQRDEEAISVLLKTMYAPSSGVEGASNYQEAMNNIMLSSGISAKTKERGIKLVSQYNKMVTGRDPQPAAYEAYTNQLEKALTGEIAPEDLADTVMSMSSAGCSMEQVNKVVSTVNSMNTNAVKQDEAFFKIVYKMIDEAYSTRGQFGEVLTGDPLQIQALKSSYVDAYNSASAEQKAEMRKLADPNSWTYQFIQGNQVKQSGGMLGNKQESNKPWSIYLPATGAVQVPTGNGQNLSVGGRKPGESVDEYLKRMGME